MQRSRLRRLVGLLICLVLLRGRWDRRRRSRRLLGGRLVWLGRRLRRGSLVRPRPRLGCGRRCRRGRRLIGLRRGLRRCLRLRIRLIG